jgi:integrase
MLLEQSILDKALSKYYNRNTIDSYMSQLRPLIGSEFSFDNVAEWVYSSSGLAASTIIVRRAALACVLDYLVAMSLCDSAIVSRIKALSFPRGKPPERNEPLDDETVDDLLGATRTTEEKALIVVLVNTGLRLGSLTNLTFELASGEQVIRSKRDKYITVYPNEDVKSVLAILMEEKQVAVKDYIFGSGKKKTYYKKLYRIFKSIAASAGHPDLRPHQIRHTFASRLDRNGISPFVIQKLLNHEQISTTMRYVTPERRSMEDAVSMLNRRHSQ